MHCTIALTKTFLSTPSMRRATFFMEMPVTEFLISIHALHEEGDHTAGFVVDV